MAPEPRASETAPMLDASGAPVSAESSFEGHSAAVTVDQVLRLGGGVSLSFVDDSLFVKDKAAAKRERAKLCGVPVGASQSSISIPFYQVLWAEVAKDAITIDYAAIAKDKVAVKKLSYPLGDVPSATAAAWADILLEKSYGKSKQKKRAKVLVNPFAGPGGVDKIWEHDIRPLFDAARMPLDVVRTKYSGEAIEICEKLDIDTYDVVIPCSGDGLVYEVFNGLGKRPDARRALEQLAVAHGPCGSGNGLSCNINGSHKPGPAALAIVKGVRTPMDLMSVTQGDRRILSFLSQSFGIVAECDLGTENLRWMGPVRFDIGVGQRILTGKTWPAEVSVKTVIADKNEIKSHYKQGRDHDYSVRRRVIPAMVESAPGQADLGEGLPPLKYGTIKDEVPADWATTTYEKLGNFYCGNMGYMAPGTNFFPAALPNDGFMDVTASNGDISTMKYAELMLSIEKGKHYDNPLLSYQKVVAYRLTPKQSEGYISIDGERIPFEPFQVEIHPGLATVLSRNGRFEAPGPLGWEKSSAANGVN